MPSIFDSASIEVTPEQTQAALADDSAQVIDVRETYEWEAGRIEGALHIELERLASNAGKIPEGNAGVKNVDFWVTLSRPSISHWS